MSKSKKKLKKQVRYYEEKLVELFGEYQSCHDENYKLEKARNELLDAIRNLTEENAKLKEAQSENAIIKWNKIEDGLPDESDIYLVYMAKYATFDVAYYLSDFKEFTHLRDKDITHWAEIPHPD